jgi:hypothetical protein
MNQSLIAIVTKINRSIRKVAVKVAIKNPQKQLMEYPKNIREQISKDILKQLI